MYLVIVEKRIVDKSFQFPVRFEKLQSFSYQLKSEGWSVLDCVPAKGGLFEVHYGRSTGSPIDIEGDKVFCVMLAHDKYSAIGCAAAATQSPLQADVGSVFTKLADGCVLLWHEAMGSADRYLTRNLK